MKNVIKNNILNPAKPFQKKPKQDVDINSEVKFNNNTDFPAVPVIVPKDDDLIKPKNNINNNNKDQEYISNSESIKMNEKMTESADTKALRIILPTKQKAEKEISPQMINEKKKIKEEDFSAKSNIKNFQFFSKLYKAPVIENKILENQQNIKVPNTEFETSIINTNNPNNDLHFSSFILDRDHGEKYLQFDIINEVKKKLKFFKCKFF